MQISWVDWDGLVYYDSKIKEFISSINLQNIKNGGEIKFEDLPDPSLDNVNYQYKILDDFTTTSDFYTPGYKYSAGTIVQVNSYDGVYLYDIAFQSQSGSSQDLANILQKINYLESLINTKADNIVFKDSNITAGIDLGDIHIGDNISNISVLELFSKILKAQTSDIPSIDNSDINYIIDNKIPCFAGLSENVLQVPFILITDSQNMNQGFYILSDNDSIHTGYQIQIPAGSDEAFPRVLIPQSVSIKDIWQFDNGLTNSWQKIANDGTTFKKNGSQIQQIGDLSITYDVYSWNVEVQGGSIYMPSSWRFELNI